jgi:two-component system NtrC family response regulator
LLRFLESGEFLKVEDSKITKVNVRIIAATNRDLQEEILKGNFRANLYYKINVFNIILPALRDRVSNIELLANYFLT